MRAWISLLMILTIIGSAYAVSPVVSVTDAPYNAKCDGTTDDSTAINNALNSGALAVNFPGSECLASSAPIIGPTNNGIALLGAVMHPGNPQSGSGIICAAALTPCVTLGGNNNPVTIRDMRIDRQGGQPAQTIVGLEIKDAYNVSMDNVMSHNHGRCFYFKNDGVLGLGFMGRRMYSGACSDAHLVNDGWPEMRVSQSRFGMNGSGDYSGNTYLRFQGGTPNTAAGPNTVIFENTQFNQGSNSVGHWLEFFSKNTSSGTYIQESFIFDNDHIEAIADGGIATDTTWTAISHVVFSNLAFVQTQVPFFVMNPATSVNDWHLLGSDIRSSDTGIAPTSQINQLTISDTTLQPGRLTIAGASNSVADLHANNLIGGLTITNFANGLINIYGGDTYGKFINNLSSSATLKMP